jgi:hypothetical protein
MALQNDSKAFSFTTFSGTEMKAFMRVTLLKGSSASAELPEDDDDNRETLTLELGLLSSIAGSITTQTKPKVVLGRNRAIGISTGVRFISGTLSFEVFSESMFRDLQRQILELEKDYEYIVFENGQKVAITDLNNFYSMPPFDIVMTAVKETNSKRRMRKVFKNVVLTSNATAIGLNTLTVQEGYDFIASDIIPFENYSVE